MRALRITTLMLATICLVAVGSATVAATADTPKPMGAVTGTFDIQRMPGGYLEVVDRVHHYRDFALAGSAMDLSDPRLIGDLVSEWNWDVASSGDQPVPAWGTITIAAQDGTWEGAFSGIRQSDNDPFGVRAMLFGDGAYEGLCATVDISVEALTMDGDWVLDGVVHPFQMG